MIEQFRNSLISGVQSSPILYIPHYHVAYIDEILESIFNSASEKGKDFELTTNAILEYSQGRGLVDFKTKEKQSDRALGFAQLLKEIVHPQTIEEGADDKRIVKKETHHIFLMKNIEKVLGEADVQGLLQTFSEKYERGHYGDECYSIVIVCNIPISTLPPQISKLLTVINIPMPDTNDIEQELGLSDSICESIWQKKEQYHSPNGYIFGKKFCYFQENFKKNKKELVGALLGMQLYDIRKILKTIQKLEGEINPQYSASKCTLAEHILREKRQLVNNSSLLEVIELDKNQKDRIGNIAKLNAFIGKQRRIIDNMVLYPSALPKPKGILLVGPPGCGKSETVKSVAAIFQKPLLRLDIGRLMGKYVGESENNLIEAIRIAEAAQPCVLWIDEIEKAFAGFGNNDQSNDITVTRMVGYFLTWMQERKSLVYLVATANDLSSLRPELLRKGRWDEIFYVSYPDEKGAADILRKCLLKYGLYLVENYSTTIIDANGEIENPAKLDSICKTMANCYFSGAEIDSLIVQAFNEDWNMTDDKFVRLATVEKLINEISKSKKAAEEKSQVKKVDDVLLELKIASGKEILQNENEIIKLLKQKYKKHTPEEMISEYKSKGYISAS